MMDSHYFFKLVDKHERGECTDQEINLLIQYFNKLSAQQKEHLSDEQIKGIEEVIWLRITNRMSKDAQQKGTRGRKLLWYSFAASVALVISVGSFFYFGADPDQPIVHTPTESFPPGQKQATLITADGQVIALDNERGGIADGGGRILYEDGTEVNTLSDNHHADYEPRTVTTPPGGQFAVVLPDGSKVWLNAQSALTYPGRFDEEKREVLLSGEAYFDVTHRESKTGVKLPFKVVTDKQTIEVVGTEFNVTAYPADENEKTTLVSGMVKVSSTRHGETAASILRPGEKGVITESGVAIHQADIQSAIAWKSGRFSFDNKPFQEIMAEFARWYNFQVVYDGPVPTPQFIGGAFRTDSISSVLHFLENANLVYNMEMDAKGSYLLTIKNRKGKK